MLDFYTAATPNGYKVAIFLEESGLEYTPRLLASDPRRRSEILQWLMLQMGGIGHEYIAGEYSIAGRARKMLP